MITRKSIDFCPVQHFTRHVITLMFPVTHAELLVNKIERRTGTLLALQDSLMDYVRESLEGIGELSDVTAHGDYIVSIDTVTASEEDVLRRCANACQTWWNRNGIEFTPEYKELPMKE